MLNRHLWLIAAGLAILSGCQPATKPTASGPAQPAPAPIRVTSEPIQNAGEPHAIAPVASPSEEPPPLAEVPAAVREQLEALGAKIDVKPNGYGIDLRRRPGFTDNEIDVLIQCPQVVDLTMESVSITDQGLTKLAAFPQLSRLILNDCPISSSGLETLARLPLHDTMISMGLRGSRVKDEDLEWLKSFPRLERLDVAQTELTDASLPILQALPLKYLNVAGTQISATGIEQLRKKHPKLVVKP